VTRVRPRPLSGTPRVSVVIPCYNYGRFLGECVDSVLSQEGVDVDVLIVDDASPDGSAEVAHQLAAADSRVRVIAREINKGHIATYNEGLAAVDGTYVLLLSADDLLAPGSLGRAAALMEANPTVGLVYGFCPSFMDKPAPARTNVTSWSIWPGLDWIEQVCRRVTNPVMTPEALVRGSLMRELGGYDPRIPYAADLLIWLRAGTRGQIGRVNGVDQAFYRKHGQNMHLQQFAGVYTDMVERLRTFDILFADDAELIPEADRLRQVVLRGLTREALLVVSRAYELGVEIDSEKQLIDLAEEMVPRTPDDPLWRRYGARLERARAGQRRVPRQVDLVKEDLWGRIRWRRWRRYGLMSEVGSV